MPRPRVKDEDRKRVARACDTCKRRKEKCDGSLPCGLCRRRKQERGCRFSDGRSRRRRGPAPSDVQSQEPTFELEPVLDQDAATAREADADADAEIAIESLLTLSGTRNTEEPVHNVDSPAVSVSHAPVPKLARLLKDGHGKFIFVGDSSTLAFLQNVRRLVKTAIGDCTLTADPRRHGMIEAIPSENVSSRTPQTGGAKPSRGEAQELGNRYLLATSGIIDLFDQQDILQHLVAWTEDRRPSSSSTSSIFYLVLAIGAQNRIGDHEEQAAYYFSKGRELASASFMDDPSVLTVQSYVLIAFYMLTTCRRNGAFMLLGIAIRAAYALGLHRSDISILFESRERTTRERVWKSLRVLDMFMSASLGRPPATSEVDGGHVAWEGTSRGYENIKLQELHSSALLRICFIFERVLNEVYCRREVSVQLVDNISRQYRDWNLGLDDGLKIDGLSLAQPPGVSDLQHLVGLAHIKGSYYWSIILLTRPFLIFDVSTKIKAGTSGMSMSHSEIVTLSEACIDAALRNIEINSDVVHAPGYPCRAIFITNAVFVSALVVGLAIFGDYDKTFPLLSSLGQAQVVLDILSKHDPAGRRYALITGYLQQAALQYIKQRDERQLQQRRREMQSIFGDVTSPGPNGSASIAADGQPTKSKAHGQASIQKRSEQRSDRGSRTQTVEDDLRREGPVLTTSGALASSMKDKIGGKSLADPLMSETPVQPTFVSLALDDHTTSPFAGDEFPLFSLMDEFDTMSDQFLDFV